MTLSLRAAAIASVMAVVASTSVMAQTTGAIPPSVPPSESSPPSTTNQFSSNEIINAGHQFFGTVSRGLAEVVEKAVSKWGLPNGYILGEEAGGAFIGGLRYGDGTLYTRNAGDLRVFWEGPSEMALIVSTSTANRKPIAVPTTIRFHPACVVSTLRTNWVSGGRRRIAEISDVER
jgi:hypothetical protein